LTADQCRSLLRAPCQDALRGKRDRAILAVLIGCGLRRAELVGLRTDDLQIREEHWVVADLIGKGKHIRTVPVPGWVKRAVDEWTQPAGITSGFIFRAVSRTGAILGRPHLAQSHLACGEGSGTAGWNRESCSPRSSPELRAPVPSRRRRIGADSVFARACFGPDDRALSRLQAETAKRGERRNRSGRSVAGASGPATGLPDNRLPKSRMVNLSG
jgi:hypothetical protein